MMIGSIDNSNLGSVDKLRSVPNFGFQSSSHAHLLVDHLSFRETEDDAQNNIDSMGLALVDRVESCCQQSHTWSEGREPFWWAGPVPCLSLA